VAADGTIYVAAGSYEGIAIDKQVLIDGTDIGGTIISSGIGYKPGSTYTTAFRLDAGADGTTIDDMTVLCLPGTGYFFAVFSRGVDNVVLDNITIYDTVQGLTNWGGSGWSILDSQVIGTVASGGGGIGIFVGATMGYETASNNLIQGNVIGSDASAPDYSCPGIVLALDLRWGRFDEFATYDLGGNQIIGNTITDSGVLNGVGIEVGVIATTGNDPALVPGILDATLGAIHDTIISGNTVAGEYFGLYLYNIVGSDVYLNVISGNTSAGIAMFDGNIDNVFRYNSISGNAYGLFNGTGTLVDAALNWWGDAAGPSGEGAGAGDSVSTNVIFSPWLGINLDGDPTTVGVQVTSPVLIIVAPVGPEPTGGYLNTAIAGANELPYADTIEVRSGTYAEDATITDPVTIESQEGCPPTTFIDGNLVLGSAGIQLGSLRHGFTIRGNLRVGAGINAAQIHVNWNNIEGQVTNTNGIGSLDATYNFWGADGPLDNIAGQVHYYPYLPVEVCAVIQYMDDYGLNPNQAIVMAKKVLKHVNPKDILAAFGLVNMCGMSMDDALAMIREYGRVKVQRALRLAHGDCAKFYTQLVGYGVGGGAGGGLLDKQIVGGGGAIEGVTLEASYTQGDTIHVAFTLTDPITGDVVTDAVATLSVVRVDPTELAFWGMIPYDSVSGQYQLDYATSGLTPGYYDLYIGTSDGQTKQLRVEIVAP
jgi:hypothetical protein